MMRIVFMGTPSFSAHILERLAEHYDVVCAYTKPDAVRGRGKALVSSPVAALADELGIPTEKPASFSDEGAVEKLVALTPDVICVASYGLILPQAVLDAARFGCLNVHASLLPRWRGAAPIERAILAGDELTGVSIMRMEAGLDTGDYCASVSTPIGNKTAGQLEGELAELGSWALLGVLDDIEQGREIAWTKQDESRVAYAAKIDKGELNISPYMTMQAVVAHVRASSDAHPSRAMIAGRSCSILEVSRADGKLAEYEWNSIDRGRVAVFNKRAYIGCSDGPVEILRIKPDGKSAMDAMAFCAGVQNLKKNGALWGGIDV